MKIEKINLKNPSKFTNCIFTPVDFNFKHFGISKYGDLPIFSTSFLFEKNEILYLIPEKESEKSWTPRKIINFLQKELKIKFEKEGKDSFVDSESNRYLYEIDTRPGYQCIWKPYFNNFQTPSSLEEKGKEPAWIDEKSKREGSLFRNRKAKEISPRDLKNHFYKNSGFVIY